jgi:hypothetical protein
MWWVLGGLLCATVLIDLLYYIGLTPDASIPPAHSSKRIIWIVYIISYALGLLRIPYMVLPYLAKLVCFLILRGRFWRMWDSYPVQIVRLGGDFLNLPVTALLINWLIGDTLLFELTLFAEAVRLISEKMQMAISGLWQLIPHQQVAVMLNERASDYLKVGLHRYVAYYSLNSEDRAEWIIRILKAQVTDPTAADKLSYITRFRIVDDDRSLRTGEVRNIPRGEIYIHRRWTNDPWLLIGQAVRRCPWLFDSRYLQRPFSYRTQSNRLSTLFVFELAPCSPPYAWYQFGHEIKVARYDAFYRILRGGGLNLEPPLSRDGTVYSDPILRQIEAWLTGSQPHHSIEPMLSDNEVIRQIMTTHLDAEQIAVRYAYPLRYVEEVLLPNACRTAEATTSGASH